MWTDSSHEPSYLKLLDPITAGHQAVMLFFVLSGFVLSIPYLTGKAQAYPIYLLRRAIRLYAPYFFALLLAVAGDAIWHGPTGHGSWADKTWMLPVKSSLVISHTAIMGEFDWVQFNTAFWSLIIEMRVSLIFPLIFLFVCRVTNCFAILASIMLAVGGAWAAIQWPGKSGWFETLMYSSVFMTGILLAKCLPRVNSWFQSLSSWSRAILSAIAFLLYTWGHRLSTLIDFQYALDLCLITVGAGGYMVVALNSTAARRWLRLAPALLLGRISYSLYLVHSTVLFSLVHIFGPRLSIAEHFLLYIVMSLGIGYLFCIAIEEPFLRLSRAAGRRLSQPVAPVNTGA
jgi:peptidoglycan/LPS O-acetylase OafA/YrhL